MNFSPYILAFITQWRDKTGINVDVRLEFSSLGLALIYSFTNPVMAKVWNKSYSAEFLRNSQLSLYDLTKETLRGAESYFKGKEA